MVIDFIGGNGGGGGTAQYATSAGTANNAKLLDGAQAFPQSANTGDVVAMNGIATRGLRDATPEAGVYQYDGTNWNKVGAEGEVTLPIGYEAEDFTGEEDKHYGLQGSADTAWIVGIDGHRVVCVVGGNGQDSEYEPRLCYMESGYSVDGFVMGAGYVFGYYDDNDDFYPIFLEQGTYALEYENLEDPDDYANGKVINIQYGNFAGQDDRYVMTIAWNLGEYGTLFQKTPLFTITEKTCPVIDGYGELVLSYKENMAGDGAYRIELSTSDPNDFTQDDEAALTDFYGALIENPSIKDNVYLSIYDDIYKLLHSEYDAENGSGVFTFSLTNLILVDEIELGFELGEYSYGTERSWSYNTLIPNYDFPTDPQEGQVASLNDGLYIYDGSDWNKVGNILKAVDEAPADASEGDVYAYHEDAEDYIVGDYWTDTGSDTAEWNSDYDEYNPQAIAIQIGKNGSLDLGYSCGDWTDSISFYVNDYVFSALGNNWEEVDGRYILSNSGWLEKTNGAKLYAIYDEDTVTLYIFTDDVTEVWPYRVDNTTAEGNIFTGTITPPHGPINKLYQMVYDEDEDALVPTEMASKTDLNGYFKAVDGTEDQDLWAWNGWDNTWGVQHRNSIVEGGLQNAFQYDSNDGLMFLGRAGEYDMGWKKVDQTILKAKDTLPKQSEDGAVYALPSSGYGIVQAQSAHTGQDWFNYEGKTVPTGWTQMRVPYNDTAESNLIHFKTDANGEGQMDIYWHPEDPNDRRWDGLPDGTQQNDGEFSTTDNWGNTIVATKVGNYIVVTFGAGVLNGDEDMSVRRNTEIYTTDAITNYKNVVMSTTIKEIVKLTQAEYDALVSGGTVDNSTFYVIISQNV